MLMRIIFAIIAIGNERKNKAIFLITATFEIYENKAPKARRDIRDLNPLQTLPTVKEQFKKCIWLPSRTQYIPNKRITSTAF